MLDNNEMTVYDGMTKEAMNEYAKKDQEAWKVWNSSPTTKNLDSLVTQVQPLILHHVGRMSTGNIPRSALEARATSLVIDALPKYDPDKTQLNTFLTWQLKQLNRYVYKHQNIGKIPESRIVNIGALNRAKTELEDMYGKDATHEELADHIKMPLSEVRLLDKELRKDISSEFSKQDMFKQTTEDIDAIYTIWADSKGNDKLILEYLYGLNGKKQLSLAEISAKLKISSVRLSQIKSKLGKQVFKYKLETMPRY